MRWALTSWLAVAGIAAALGAAAQTGAATSAQIEEARRLFRDALAQEVAGDWAGALTKLEAVAKVKLTHQVRFHLARCKEHLGRYTEARGDYRLALYEAQQAKAAEAPEIEQALDALEQRLPTLVLRVPAELAGVQLELDGVRIGAGQLAEPLPVDPGAHRVVATLRDGRRWERAFVAADGEAIELEVTPPAAVATPAPAPPLPSPPQRPSPEAAPPPTTSSSPALAPWVAVGVGGVGLVAAGTFYWLHRSAEADLDAGCVNDVCPTALEATQQRSDRYALLSGVSLGVGAAGLGTALVLWLTEREPAAPAPATARGLRWQLEPSVGARWQGVRFGGRF